ncbi:hypothetical protein DFA_11139 [Cavenderia fasciculata]|uniref:Uncharacterized protein n=1 Tax=Cavenderia fasciculata TaxID=261658 RepID=F4QF19_CACFS|nr:uncharacterized protein DFA_11139 [Cavenderia fasciculata]EGG13378.1 hypothetical protein DFA_11139 [Cavenderia fasciculata]|eukprot:XP_004350082.1 hypothetical protein DFA_11139 [Cavenderia fasciculata]
MKSYQFIVLVFVLLLLLAPFNLKECNAQDEYAIHPDEVDSLEWIIKQYVIPWKINKTSNVLTDMEDVKYTDYVTVNTNGQLTRLKTPYYEEYFDDDGPPDKNLPFLNFTALEALDLQSIPRDGSINFMELTKAMPNLFRLTSAIEVDSYPEGFPYSKKIRNFQMLSQNVVTYPKNFNLLYWPSLNRLVSEPVPIGFGHGMGGSIVIGKLKTYFPYPFTLSDSMCGFDSVVSPSTTDFDNPRYAGSCFRCFYRDYTPFTRQLGPPPEPTGEGPYINDYIRESNCEVTITSVRYNGNSITVYGNNIIGGAKRGGDTLKPFQTRFGTITPIKQNSIFKYDRNSSLNSPDEDVPIGYSTLFKSFVVVKISFTPINMGDVQAINQVPFGIKVSIVLNYNHNILHTMSINGAPCKCEIIQILVYNNETINSSNNSNNNIGNYSILLTGYFGNISNTTIAKVEIDSVPCIVLMINSTTIECNMTIDSNHYNNQDLGVQQVETYIEIDSHSLSSTNIIYFNISNHQIIPSSSSSSNNDNYNDDDYQSKTKIYIIVSVVGAVILCTTFFIVRKVAINPKTTKQVKLRLGKLKK